MVRSWFDRHAEALRHVESGRRILERQRALIARHCAHGESSVRPEDVLAVFERTQALFESDLERIMGECR